MRFCWQAQHAVCGIGVGESVSGAVSGQCRALPGWLGLGFQLVAVAVRLVAGASAGSRGASTDSDPSIRVVAVLVRAVAVPAQAVAVLVRIISVVVRHFGGSTSK